MLGDLDRETKRNPEMAKLKIANRKWQCSSYSVCRREDFTALELMLNWSSQCGLYREVDINNLV